MASTAQSAAAAKAAAVAAHAAHAADIAHYVAFAAHVSDIAHPVVGKRKRKRSLLLRDRRYRGALRVADKLGEPGSPARAAYLERWRLERLGVLHPCMPLPKPIE